MDGRGGCCIARHATGAYDMSKVNRIMLRFRPIAPKPAVGTATSGGSSSESSDGLSRGVRTKRKYARDTNSNNGNKRCNKRRKSSAEQKDAVVTLPLLPETPDRKDSQAKDLTVSAEKGVRNRMNVPMWLSFENCAPPLSYWHGGANDQPLVTASTGVMVAGSCVTVECVTETWVDGDGLGGTDEERRLNLAKDTCPGFISDGYGRVTWINGPYRDMVGHDNAEGEKIGVCLVMKEKAGMTLRALVRYPSFTCRVRVQYTCGKEKSSLIVPCDAWRMDSGGFAWRLDVKAALSLSLGR
ncbi:hypothetical protein L6164_014831 [Bauhinia variegata]|uniref:Uncharacterized protein n=1 Tax=Bauhinia variegata TaxID=167791 RepID=A0ACB9NK08_BAUVA|nr:hypothetical protein L6164_014831 [Bauhinia variegata]